MKYRGNYLIWRISEDIISEIKKMLNNKWQVADLFIISLSGNNWKMSFVTEDHKKIFKLVEIIKHYGGDVYHWIEKLQEEENT